MKQDKKILCSLFLSFLIIVCTSCGSANLFTPMSNKQSDEAYIEDLNKLLNAKDWDNALVKLSSLSTDARNTYDVVKIEASIYAGRCGLDFLDFFTNLGTTSALFGSFMSGFRNAVVSPADCQTAQNLIETRFGADAATRTTNLGTTRAADVNFFMAMLGAAKIGAQLSAVADTSPKDGTMDGGFTSCNSGAISDAQIAQVGTGFALMLTNFTTIASYFSSSSSSLISSISAQCAALTPNPCAVTDPNNSTWTDPAALLAIRSLIRSSSIGIDSTSCTADNGGNPLPYPFDCCP